MVLRFSDPHLPELLERADDEELERAPFGLVRMDPAGRVELYNRREAELSGLDVADCLGKNFFVDVAPCTNNFMVAERFREDGLDLTLEYVFTYVMESTEVMLRLLRRGQNLYILVEPK